MRRFSYLIAVLLALLMPLCALGEEAEEITQLCQYRLPGIQGIPAALDGNYKTSWSSRNGRSSRLEITAPEGKAIGGLYVQFFGHATSFEVLAPAPDGEWAVAARSDTDTLTVFVPLAQELSSLALAPSKHGDFLDIAELRVFSCGEPPAWVQRWQPPCEKADLLALLAHPDDEVLFLGGLLPLYAGERGFSVQVCHLVPCTPYRQLELLDALWTCGVTHYPDIASFFDVNRSSAAEMYRADSWQKKRVYRHTAGLLRRYKPEVVVTHDLQGEYGHGAHKVCADAMLACAELAADASFQPEQAEALGVWQVKKLYLHLYPDNVVDMDWRMPLARFGGKTAFEMAEEAYACHKSQVKDTRYRVEDWGPYDNSLFGLAYSAVGPDEAKQDLMEHISPRAPQ